MQRPGGHSGSSVPEEAETADYGAQTVSQLVRAGGGGCPGPEGHPVQMCRTVDTWQFGSLETISDIENFPRGFKDSIFSLHFHEKAIPHHNPSQLVRLS